MDGTSFYLPSLLDSMVAGRSTRRWNASATNRHSTTSSTGRNVPRTGICGTIQSRTGRWVRYRLNETRPSQRNGAVESSADTA